MNLPAESWPANVPRKVRLRSSVHESSSESLAVLLSTEIWEDPHVLWSLWDDFSFGFSLEKIGSHFKRVVFFSCFSRSRKSSECSLPQLRQVCLSRLSLELEIIYPPTKYKSQKPSPLTPFGHAPVSLTLACCALRHPPAPPPAFARPRPCALRLPGHPRLPASSSHWARTPPPSDDQACTPPPSPSRSSTSAPSTSSTTGPTGAARRDEGRQAGLPRAHGGQAPVRLRLGKGRQRRLHARLARLLRPPHPLGVPS